MSDEIQNLAEVTTAPESEVTATPESVESAPVVTDNDVEDKIAEKTYTQTEIDAMIGKRLAREQRKWEREQQVRQAPEPATFADIPTPDQFQTPQDYAQFIRTEAEKLVKQQEYQKQHVAIEDAYTDREEEARNKYDDFEQVAYNPKLRVTEVMAETIKSSDIGPDLAYWLGTNPKEADRISQLSPLLQAREIGRIEAKLGDNPVVKPTTSAPAPIRPVTARTSGASTYDTTDPRSIKAMSASEWIEAERARQMKKLQAQTNR
jgi:hypothetical protein